jgi:hypothetical protein
LDPKLRKALIDAAWDLGVNFFAEESEGRAYFPEKHFDDEEMRIARAISESIRDAAGRQFADRTYNRDYMLAGFECATQDLDHEVGMLAWSRADDPDAFTYSVASRGTTGSVKLPVERAWPSLVRRVRDRIPTKLLAVHNHPRGPVKDFVEELIGGRPLGPSGTDRNTTWSWLDIQVRSGFVIEPEFVLYESGEFRRIRWPSASSIRDLWERIQAHPAR